jgi:hypothetical protein
MKRFSLLKGGRFPAVGCYVWVNGCHGNSKNYWCINVDLWSWSLNVRMWETKRGC